MCVLGFGDSVAVSTRAGRFRFSTPQPARRSALREGGNREPRPGSPGERMDVAQSP